MSAPMLAQTFAGVRILLAASYSSDALAGSAYFAIARDGTVGYLLTGTPTTSDWIAPKSSTVGDAYTARFHQTAGTAVSGSAVDTDITINATLQWNTVDLALVTGTLTLKKAGVTLATSTISIAGA